MTGSTNLNRRFDKWNKRNDWKRRNNEYLKEKNGTYLVAPLSATWLDPYLPNKGLEGLRFREVWRDSKHLNLDDLDWAEDGVWNTLKRVVGRRGLAAWRVTKSCPGKRKS